MVAYQNTITLQPTSVAATGVLGVASQQIIDTLQTDWLVFQIAGTFVGTLVCEGSFDKSTWAAHPLYDATNALVAGATAPGIYLAHTRASNSRLRCSAYTSGTILLLGGYTDFVNAR